ncbi:MAG TPA: hypothetical protein VHC86_10765 [Opitutaceae bacterium]|nr:hypothetical protein [Opitutaceae bacterium]
MPSRLNITPKDKRRLIQAYARGETPFDIARTNKELGLTAKQISNLAQREGWTQRKAEIAEMKRQSVREVLERAKEEGVANLEPVLRDIAAGLKIDAERLVDAWDLVKDAPGASALMRAKNLHLDRVQRLFEFGRHSPQGQGPADRAATLALIFTNQRFEDAGAVEAKNITSSAAPAGVVEEDLEFA